MGLFSTDGVRLVIKLGEFTYTYDLAFLASVAIAVLVVFFFSLKKFEETTLEKRDDDFTSELLPKFLTSPEEYSRALILYTTAMSVIVVVLSFLGPRVVGIGAQNIPDAPSALPMFIALVIVGVLPNVPWLQQLEFHLRRFAHQRAFIPKAARAVSDKLASAEFNFNLYKTDVVLNSAAMSGVERSDFNSPRDSIEYAWARLSCLLYRFKYLQDAGVALSFDDEVLTRYTKDLEALVLKRKALMDEIARYRQHKTLHPYHSDDDLHATLRKTLRKVYLLLGCAVRLRIGTAAEINPSLKPFGFILTSGVIRSEHKDLMIVGLAVMAAAVFGLVYLAAPVGGLAARLLGTELSDEFPNDGWEAVAWLFSALLVHGTAILVAERMRTRRVGDGRWLRVGSAGTRGTPATYITVAFACAIISSVPLFLFSLVFVEPSWGLARQLAPFSLLPSSTGAFFVWHLDNCDLGKRPSRTWEIGLQAIITGLCAGVAANMSGFALDLIALNAAVGAAIGASLAWYLPNAAMNSKEATQTEVTDESQKTSNVDLVHLSNDRIAA